jgi:diguanylate cyclase (GGDEF)-like protein
MKNPGLRVDAITWAALGLAVATLALRPLAATGDQVYYLDAASDLAFVLLAIVALLAGLGRLPSRDERRFWAIIAGSFGCWAVVLALYLALPDAWWTRRFDLVVDSIYLAFYLLMLAAVDGRPDLSFERRLLALGGRYRLPGAAVFSVGLFLYFVVVPARLNPELYGSWSPSMVLYLALDLYLTARLLILTRVARGARWRRCFALTAVIAGLFLVTDVVELLVLLQKLPAEPSLPWQALWWLPSIAIVATIRRRALPAAGEGGVVAETGWTPVENLAQGAPFLAYVLFLPLIHFIAYRAGLFDDVTRAAHENLVLGWLIVLGAAALVQYLDLERKNVALLDQRRLTEERLWRLANFDQLTGLPNRILFRDRLSHALKQAHRGGRQVALVFCDLDDFKRINDTYGHAAGDELLRRAARRLVGSVRDSDTVARLGGDELTVILEALDDAGHVEHLTRRITEALGDPFEIGDQIVTLGSSLGVAVAPRDGEDVDTLLASADAAMYEAKRGQRSQRSRARFVSVFET